jgi:CRISPR system Cascade subunit CasB
MGGKLDRYAQAAGTWWRRLQPDRPAKRPGDPATLARLRRAASSTQALAEAETLRLWQLLEVEYRWLSRVGTVARVLAHVRTAGEPGRRGSLVRALGPREFGKDETARLKRLRFERLLAMREEEDLARAMIRLVHLAGRETPIDVGDLAASILTWDEEVTRIAWAFAYHDPGAAPGIATASHDEAA